MKDYEARFVIEYLELTDRLIKLQRMLEKNEKGELDFHLTNKDLLYAQRNTMGEYKKILETRAKQEDIDLPRISHEAFEYDI